MIRDITIGQYYPADSILHRLDPRVKIREYVGLYCIFICIFFLAGIRGGSTVSGGDDCFVQSSFRIYDKGIKADHGAVADYDVF